MDRQAKTSGTDHNMMRELNRTLILDLLKQQGPRSRAGLAKATSLAKPTVSAIVEDLLGDGLVTELGLGTPAAGGGRPPMLLEFNARSQHVVGVHVGVRRTTAVVADACGEELARVEGDTVRGEPAEQLATIGAQVRKAITLAGADRASAVGVCVPGLVDIPNGVCVLAPNLGWRHVPVAATLGADLEAPVFVHNTAQAVAVAENVEGTDGAAPDLVLLYAGSGVGAGIISNGRLLHGSGGIAGELGHCYVPGATDLCNCGKIGCLETVAGGSWLTKRVRRRLQAGEVSVLASHRRLESHHIATAAEDGDELATDVLRQAGEALGIALSTVINLFNPSVVVLAGGVISAGEALLDALYEAVRVHALPQALAQTHIRLSQLEQDAEVRGAVLLALQHSETYYRVIFQG